MVQVAVHPPAPPTADGCSKRDQPLWTVKNPLGAGAVLDVYSNAEMAALLHHDGK